MHQVFGVMVCKCDIEIVSDILNISPKWEGKRQFDPVPREAILSRCTDKRTVILLQNHTGK